MNSPLASDQYIIKSQIRSPCGQGRVLGRLPVLTFVCESAKLFRVTLLQYFLFNSAPETWSTKRMFVVIVVIQPWRRFLCYGRDDVTSSLIDVSIKWDRVGSSNFSKIFLPPPSSPLCHSELGPHMWLSRSLAVVQICPHLRKLYLLYMQSRREHNSTHFQNDCSISHVFV